MSSGRGGLDSNHHHQPDQAAGASPPARRTAWRLAASAVIAGALTSAGFAIVGLIEPSAIAGEGATTAAAQTFARYAAARSAPLAVAVILAVVLGARRALGVLALLTGTIQAADAFVGATLHDWGKTIGPLVLASTSGVAARWLLMWRSRSLERRTPP